MKKINQKIQKNFFKRKFVQLCRFFGYEIIDQNSFEVPTLQKNLTETLPSTRSYMVRNMWEPEKKIRNFSGKKLS